MLGSVYGKQLLIPHPSCAISPDDRVHVFLLDAGDGKIAVEFHIHSFEGIYLPAPRSPKRADGLWKTTCCELFIQPVSELVYYEYNFSPSFEWAAYSFDRYREGMRELPLEDPEIWLTQGSDLGSGEPPVGPVGEKPANWIAVEPEASVELPPYGVKIGLSAVVETIDGNKSYWALHHPDPEKPDFHHPDCFTLELPPPNDI